ncbi:maleate cis-trans isomerase family protein [Bordetella bronchiseptica]|uniref:maleate cis-trans isomerase family protein n=1 Tax=Bordetella bronchiseptica TaxID=518 RepID=UPI00081D2B43|nr:aspartate/glutamate racemase family protein [Bordetella bronchiseptica]AOB26068.1 decarboxylase [Bordetella bronchiseptica]AZW43353.1 decarboxylase [Bordetella bronchiseptica]
MSATTRMKTTARYRPYAWRAKIGLIVPSTNTINEPEFYRLAPDGVTIHTGRAINAGPATQENYDRMARGVLEAADLIKTAEVDVVAYGCTSGSIVCSLDELCDGMSERVGVPAIATAGAVVAALRALGVRRIAVGTPYIDFVNQREREFLEQYGFEVVSIEGLDLGHTQEERRDIGRVPPQSTFQLARDIDRPQAEAIFLSCTNLATLDMIERIENELGKPVVTSNQATFWACLRLLGLSCAIPGYGRLLTDCLAPITRASYSPA